MLTIRTPYNRQPAPNISKRTEGPNLRERGVRYDAGRGRGAAPARGRGQAASRGRGTGRGGRDRERENKTVEDLDRELEEFMASGSKEVSYLSCLRCSTLASLGLISCNSICSRKILPMTLKWHERYEYALSASGL